MRGNDQITDQSDAGRPLDHSEIRTRQENAATVEAYVEAMRKGIWTTSDKPVVFTEETDRT